MVGIETKVFVSVVGVGGAAALLPFIPAAPCWGMWSVAQGFYIGLSLLTVVGLYRFGVARSGYATLSTLPEEGMADQDAGNNRQSRVPRT